ncbi:hypothetical protein TREMEDRAFT_62441 [Tremella mesenterica DSM 1558]|uniref:uncharacterized protein n=1 Tax=Tremella mesenterica (strain ATCC 24925 / CBS 8224 / DSM 1558 / NBRC 9311 / NRRL Y-6157 / RJB 2259-6 / UBC 559-6) TaxID=578456 RepID=UPI0003F49F2C|nr:uncharacterized protein TREMEDRAFT_62441 [Tremella mesenterica DSM 1558]EIW69581.1 hypothetical protein TREMEDRAFT_62441 [Tremella mesenterica DSM 1558]
MLWTKVFSLLAIQTLVFASYYQVGNLTGPSTIKAGKKFTATLIIYEVSFFDVDLSVAWGLVDPSAEDVYNFGILLGVDTLIHKLSAGVHQVNYTLTTPTELLGPYTLAAYVTREAGVSKLPFYTPLQLPSTPHEHSSELRLTMTGWNKERSAKIEIDDSWTTTKAMGVYDIWPSTSLLNLMPRAAKKGHEIMTPIRADHHHHTFDLLERDYPESHQDGPKQLITSVLAVLTSVFATYRVGNLTAPSTIRQGQQFTATLYTEVISGYWVDLSVVWGLVAPDNQDDFSIGTLIGVNVLYPTFPHGPGQKTFQLSVPQGIHGPYTLRALLPYDSAENHEFSLNQLNWDLTIL